jgi:hypothetical protein
MQRDPLGQAAGVNLFSYCGNNPVLALDPSGCDPGDGDPADIDLTGSGSLGGFESGIFQQGLSNLISTFPGIGHNLAIGQAKSNPIGAAAAGFSGALSGCDFFTNQPLGTVQRWSAGVGAALSLAQGVTGLLAPEEGAAAEGADEASQGLAKLEQACEGANCFSAGTPVQMADGSIEPIEQVKIGDRVKSRDPVTGMDEDETVEQIFAHPTAQLIDLRVSDGESLTCTPEHRIYVAGIGFEEAGSLHPGDALVCGDGETASKSTTVTVTGITWRPEATTLLAETEVYNFEVSNTHTYFVGANDGGIWVHNACQNVTWPTSMTPEEVLGDAEDWLGDGYTQATGRPTEPDPAVWRSQPDADGNVYQFRMQDSDLIGQHGSIGSHVHFQILDQVGNEIWNLHVPVL